MSTEKTNITVFDATIVSVLAKCLDIGKASQLLGLSRPAFNAALSRLEKKIAKLLFVRKQKSGEVTIAPSGVDLIPIFQKISALGQAIQRPESTWNAVKNEGRVIVSSTQTLLECFVAPYAPLFLNKNPNLDLFLYEHNHRGNEAQALNEIAIGWWEGNEDNFTYIPYHGFKQKLWASKEYIHKFGAIESIEDLEHHRLLCSKSSKDPSHHLGSDILQRTLAHKADDLRVYSVCGTRILDILAQNHMGVMLASEETVKLSGLTVVNVLPSFEGETTEIYIKVDKRFLDTACAQYTIDWLMFCKNIALESIGTQPTESYTFMTRENKEELSKWYKKAPII